MPLERELRCRKTDSAEFAQSRQLDHPSVGLTRDQRVGFRTPAVSRETELKVKNGCIAQIESLGFRNRISAAIARWSDPKTP